MERKARRSAQHVNVNTSLELSVPLQLHLGYRTNVGPFPSHGPPWARSEIRGASYDSTEVKRYFLPFLTDDDLRCAPDRSGISLLKNQWNSFCKSNGALSARGSESFGQVSSYSPTP